MTTAFRRTLVLLLFVFLTGRGTMSAESPRTKPKLVLIKANQSAARFLMVNTTRSALEFATAYAVYTKDMPLVADFVRYEYRENGKWHRIKSADVGVRASFRLEPHKKVEFDVSLDEYSWIRLRAGTLVRVIICVTMPWSPEELLRFANGGPAPDRVETYSAPFRWRPNQG